MEIPHAILIYGVVQTVGLLIPIIMIGYRQGRKDQFLDEMKRDLDGLGEKLSKVAAKTDGVIEELREKMAKVDRELGEISVALKFISERLNGAGKTG